MGILTTRKGEGGAGKRAEERWEYRVMGTFARRLIRRTARERKEEANLGESRRVPPSGKAKPGRSLGDGEHELAPERLVVGIRAQVNLVEASVRRRDPVGVPVGPVDLDGLDAVGPDELREPAERDARAGGRELEELGSFGLREGPQGAPEPDDLGVAVAPAMELNRVLELQ